MSKSKPMIIFLLLLLPGMVWGQTKFTYTVSGTIKDKATGETLPAASVTFLELPGKGATTNSYGFYSITIPAGSYTMITSYTGYATDTLKVVMSKNIVVNSNLKSGYGQLQEVKIKSSNGRSNNILTTPAGVQRLNIKDLNNVPVLLGEKDVLKTIQLLPGIVSAGDGRSGFFVRGGGSDQNLILLDEATVYNPSHVLGFFSVFNSDAIKDISIYKGGMPANYGGRLSSVEDIQMNDGNNQKFGASGGLGLIASRLTLEGPLFDHKGSFIISARRSYADLFTRFASDTTTKHSKIYFYDVNLKANYQLDSNNRIFLSGYFGKDVMSFRNSYGLDYGNSTGTLRWNHIFSSKLFSNTSLIYSNYTYDVDFDSDLNNIKVSSAITDYHFKQDFNYYLNATNKLSFGLEYTFHVTKPGTAIATAPSSYNDVFLEKKYALESAVYLSDEWNATDNLKITYGIRLSDLMVLGPGNFYTYDKAGNKTDSTYYKSGQIVKSYIIPEPRFAASYQLNKNSSLKLSYDRNAQNIHLLNNSSYLSVTNVYLPSSNNIKPEISDQVAMGFYHTFHDNGFEFSTEIYYKKLQNQIDYVNGADLVANPDIEADLLYGSGRSYGWETYIKKKSGRFTGWLSYTFSKTELKIPGINNGQYYPATQDQTNHVSLVGMYQASKKWTFSADFVYNTGDAVTWPAGKFSVDGAPVYTYGARNSNRLPAYNRLDIGATLLAKKTAKYESSWNFSIYNVYGESNPYDIVFQTDPKNANKTQVLQTTLFKMIPSVTYNFKF
ncbi:TonB-dependent Receptor Plug Domain [Mucilaginibacter mallensis]|uniref:TonB-dependent Receptor Plug Domain n=1 Tax=Mucilaginibacter mallensis TaxID=652787 RepID=A0A1H2CD73_MUCMA|nr:TonB-dependent receptor [Mucilaginibacter mallensis]SDT68470.1 TonB-dependent Receptor Plug Domain [Mucilaginibacter mallensis]